MQVNISVSSNCKTLFTTLQQTNKEDKDVKKVKTRKDMSHSYVGFDLSVSSSLSIPPSSSHSITSSRLSLSFSSTVAKGGNQLPPHPCQHLQFPSVIGPWLPWRRHWLWVLEVGHDDCRDGQPVDETKTSSTDLRHLYFNTI